MTINFENNLIHTECASDNFDSAYYLDNYFEFKKPVFEAWFKDDKLEKVQVDGKVIDFTEKLNMADIVDRAVDKLIDFKYRLNSQLAK